MPRRPTTRSAPTVRVDVHVADFVGMVRERLDRAKLNGSAGPPMWWRRSTPSCSGTGGTRDRCGSSGCCAHCPRPGCAVGTLSDAVADGFVGAPVELPPSSWGSGKDWQVWAGEKVADLVQLNAEVVDTALTTVDKALGETDAPPARNFVADQILRETLLTVSSDWPFMVSKDSAADYARYRAHLHAHATREIAGALASGRSEHAQRLADGWNRADGLFGALDAKAPAPMTLLFPRASRVCTPTRRECMAFCASLARGSKRPMKVLMVSWEYPPVVVGGLGRHVYQLATALAAAGHEVVVLSRRPSGTDPSTHPSTDEIAEGVRVVAAAQDPHEFDFGADMMAWTLAMGHSMVRAGLAIKRPPQSAVAPRRRARPRLAGRTPGDRSRRILRRPTGFHHPRHRGRHGIRAGYPVESAARCTPSNRGWFANPIRSSPVRRR